MSMIDVDEGEEADEKVIDGDFIDDENVFHENIEDYYAFINVSRSVEDAIQDSFIDFDYSQEAHVQMITILVRILLKSSRTSSVPF